MATLFPVSCLGNWACFFLPADILLSSTCRFRQMCQSIITHKLFDYVVLVFIFSNCITVALERPKILQGSLVNPSGATQTHFPGGLSSF